MKNGRRTTTVQKASDTAAIMVARCFTCKHAERSEIEYSYRHRLMSIQEMSETFGINPRGLYRHFGHSGLADERNNDLLSVLDKVIDTGFEQGLDVRAENVLRAVELRAKMTGRLMPDNQGTTVVSLVQVLRQSNEATLAALALDAEAEIIVEQR